MERYELPEGWEWRALGDHEILTDIQPGYACGKKDVEGGAIHLRMNNVSKTGTLDWSLIRRIPADVAEKSKKWLQPGDVIFNNTNSTELVGKSCLFIGWSEPCAFSNHLTRLRCHLDRLLPEWLHYCLRDLWLMGFFAANCKEFVGQSAFNTDKLKEVEIPIPPLPEQNRLVARIEALAQRIEAGRKVQREVIDDVEGMFERAMNLVFSEDNIADWPEYPTADLFSMVSGQVDPRQEPYSDMHSVAPDNVEKGTGRLIGQIKTAGDLELSSGKYLFRPEHVIYSKIRPALRKVCIPRFAGVCSADMYALKPNADLISQDFLLLSLLSPPFTNYAVDNSDRNAMPKINRKVLFGYRMRVPDFPTQERLSAYLLGIRERSDEIACLQRSANSDLAALLPAILAKAFRGEL